MFVSFPHIVFVVVTAREELDEQREAENEDRIILKNGDINLRRVRPTEMKQNTRIIPPMEATMTSEAAIITQEDAVRRCIADYYSNCGDQSVLTEKELKGQKLISARVRKKEILVKEFDKT